MGTQPKSSSVRTRSGYTMKGFSISSQWLKIYSQGYFQRDKRDWDHIF